MAPGGVTSAPEQGVSGVPPHDTGDVFMATSVAPASSIASSQDSSGVLPQAGVIEGRAGDSNHGVDVFMPMRTSTSPPPPPPDRVHVCSTPPTFDDIQQAPLLRNFTNDMANHLQTTWLQHLPKQVANTYVWNKTTRALYKQLYSAIWPAELQQRYNRRAMPEHVLEAFRSKRPRWENDVSATYGPPNDVSVAGGPPSVSTSVLPTEALSTSYSAPGQQQQYQEEPGLCTPPLNFDDDYNP